MNKFIPITPLLCLMFTMNSFCQDISFTKLTSGDIVNDGGWNYAMAWADFDNDGLADLFVTNNDADNGKLNFLYMNNGDGTFEKSIEGSIVSDGGSSYGCSAADANGDGYPDLFVANHNEHNFLYLSNGDGTFDKLTEGDIVNNGGKSVGASWADYNLDEHLDLYVANRDQTNFLYKGLGSGEFEKVSGDPTVSGSDNSSGCAWGDYDNDSYPDLYVANSGSPSKLFHNNGDGSFSLVEEEPFSSDISNCSGASWGDCDNDGDLDLFVSTGQLGTYNNWFYMNNGDGSFSKITDSPLVNDVSWSSGSAWGDYDKDGDLDLAVGGYDGDNLLFNNDGTGTFTKVEDNTFVDDGGYTEGLAWADTDNDGDLDIFTAKNNYFGGNNSFFLNDGNENNWLKVKVISNWFTNNYFAIGARITVWATIDDASVRQTREVNCQSGGGQGGQNEHTQFFGLGSTETADSVIVQWQDFTLTEVDVASNQTLTMDLLFESVKETKNLAEEFHVYPNPTRGVFTIDLSKYISFDRIVITDLWGKEWLNIPSNRTNSRIIRIDPVSLQLVPGIYFIQVMNKQNIKTRKIVINK